MKTSLQNEVQDRFGVLPNFFRLAAGSPEITANLWGFARFGYLDNPLPSLFKERLFVYLSRFCDVRYCITRHVGFLVGLGRPSGDEQTPAQTVEQVIQLIRRPLPRGAELEPYLAQCAAQQSPLAELPEPDSALEEAIFACATHIFLQTPDAPACLAVLKNVFGEVRFQHLLVFLAFVRTAHFWTKVHPELTVEEDLAQLLQTHQALSECLLNDPEAEPRELGQKLLDELQSLRSEQVRHDELKQAHEALRAQEKQLQTLFDAMPLGAYLVDADFRIRQVNPIARAVFGDIPDLIGRDFDEVIHLVWPKDYADNFVHLFRQTLETGEPYFMPEHIEARLDRGLTESYEWEIHRTPLSDGRFGVLCYFRDISAQVSARQKIAESEARYRSLVSILTDVPWTTDAAGAFVEPQTAWAEYTGQTWEEMQGFGWATALHPEDRTRIQTIWQKAIADKSNYEAYGRVWHAASSGYRHFIARATPLFNPDNSIREWVGTCTDIHERARAEAAVRESEERFSKAFNASPLVLTISSLTTGKLIEVNDTFVNITGYTRAEALGKTTLELGLWKRPADRAAEMETVRQIGQLSHAEYTFQTRSGQEIIGLLAAEKIEIGGELCALTVIQDITERKQADERLRESELRYRATFDNAAMGIAHVGFDGRWLRINDAVCVITGYTREELLNKTFADITHPDDVEMDWEQAHRLIAGEISTYSMEKRYLHKNGSLVWIYLTVSLMNDVQGVPQNFISVIEDITDRKQAEERLQEQQRLTQNIIEAAPTLTYIYDLVEARNVFISSQSLPILGYTREEISAMGSGLLPHLIHPDDAPRTAARFQRMMLATDHDILELEYRMKRKDGSWVWLWSRDRIFKRDAQGTPTQILGVATDITQRKQAAEELETAYYRYRVAEEAAKGLNYEWNLDTGVVTRSESMQRVIGYKREELAQTWRAWWELIHPDDRIIQSQAEAMDILRKGEEDSFDGEYRVRHKDGHYIWVMERGLLIRDVQGTVRRVIGQTVDITERRQLEAERERLLAEEQEARAQAEAATRAKDEFLAVVSHELRSPLNAILGYSRLLRTQRRNDPEIAQITNIIERNGRMQIQLIEDLLDTARIISGKLKLEIKPVELTEVVAAALDTVRPAADSKNIALDLAFETDVYQIMGDADRLQQVVWNLLSNAIKFTPEGGRVLLALTHQPSAVQIVVSDTGQGIAPDLLPFIFDRFRQGDSSSTRRFGGLGLGLALVRHLVELHGGEVRVESAGKARGATFTVTLPLRNVDFGLRISGASKASKLLTEPDQSASPDPNSAMLMGLRALIVDDEEAARELVALTLREYGAIAVTAASPDAAIAALEAAALDAPFDLLLSDIGMPGEDGYSLIRRVRTHANPKVREIRAVALTAYARAEDRLKALAAGYQMHIPKPVEENELTMVAASVTGRL
jgi:PAS domain S-box-containing protein